MTAQGTWRNGRFVGPAETKSVVVNIDRAVNGSYPVLRFPAPGYVQNAYVIADVSTSGTNLIQASVINGGIDGSGTTITAPISSGTLLSGSLYMLTVTGSGPESYKEGEIAMLKLTTENTTTDIQVQIDYVVDHVPGVTSSPLSPPNA